MKSSVLYGGDLHSALDWLCLNLRDGKIYNKNPDKVQVNIICNVMFMRSHTHSDCSGPGKTLFMISVRHNHIKPKKATFLLVLLLKDELPEGFSQRLREQENSKSRTKFQDQQQEKSRAVTQNKNPKPEEQQRAKVNHLLYRPQINLSSGTDVL